MLYAIAIVQKQKVDALQSRISSLEEDENKKSELDLTKVEKKHLKEFVGKKKDDEIEFLLFCCYLNRWSFFVSISSLI